MKHTLFMGCHPWSTGALAGRYCKERLALIAALSLLGMTGLAHAEDESAVAKESAAKAAPQFKTAKAGLEDLSWLSGRWTGSMGDQSLEETWSAVDGDSMIGMFRWVRDGKIWLYEFLTLRAEGDSVVLRFRHFGPALGCWEEKETPLTLNLTKIEKGMVRFTLVGDKDPWHYTYRLSPDGDGLQVTVGESVDGKKKGSQLRFTRTK
ncbi:MAG: DUF6265 family protein [Phycisphaerae bacterium]